MLDFNDLLIVPAKTSMINSRSEITFDKLPLFTAPMNTVITEDNMHVFKDFNICLPRLNRGLVEIPNVFISYGLDEFEEVFLNNYPMLSNDTCVLLDVANGHMHKVYKFTRDFKRRYICKLMVGNIANPETFITLQEAGADYIRVGIGNGGACLTTVQTGVGFPMASLIAECNIYKTTAKIVADGGMKTYSDIIKALALGADYVMLGSILNRMQESAGETVDYNGIPHKRFTGMSHKNVQESWGKKKLTTSEGIDKFFPIEYTYSQWVENFTDYLKSAMSYTGRRDLTSFIGGPEFIEISQNAYNRFAK